MKRRYKNCGKISASFKSEKTFLKQFRYNYPIGTFFGNDGLTHNGSAKMDVRNVHIKDNKLCIGAIPINTSEKSCHNIPIKYQSGAIHMKETIRVSLKKPRWVITAKLCIDPATKGVWPALWLSGIKEWPPEINIFEVKNGTVWQNTMQGGDCNDPNRRDDSAITNVQNLGCVHTYTCEMEFAQNGEENGDIITRMFIDDGYVATHIARGHANKDMHLILNLQMTPDATENEEIWLECHQLSVVCEGFAFDNTEHCDNL